MLVDGLTTIEFDILEAGQSIMIVNEEDRVPLPIGEYELQDGQILKVLEDGVIGEIGTKQEEEEPATEEVVEEEVEMEVEKPTAKKVVESTVKETHFSKEEKENLEKEIEELKAKITELSKVEEKVEEVKVELSEEEVKPISFNPENKQQHNQRL
jgi:outer membrane biosynthesis protein TonB